MYSKAIDKSSITNCLMLNMKLPLIAIDLQIPTQKKQNTDDLCTYLNRNTDIFDTS